MLQKHYVGRVRRFVGLEMIPKLIVREMVKKKGRDCYAVSIHVRIRVTLIGVMHVPGLLHQLTSDEKRGLDSLVDHPIRHDMHEQKDY